MLTTANVTFTVANVNLQNCKLQPQYDVKNIKIRAKNQLKTLLINSMSDKILITINHN